MPVGTMKTEYTVHSSTLKMDETPSSKTLLLVDKTVRCLVLEHHKFYVDSQKLKIYGRYFILAPIFKEGLQHVVRAGVCEDNIKPGFDRQT
jgi:hypothetical protein